MIGTSIRITMDLYVVLGLPHGATESDIKRAYRRLARRFHPDINPGDRMAEARFRQILEAYETLIDPDRRSRYDSGGGRGSVGPAAAQRLRGVRLLGARRRPFRHLRRSLRRSPERSRHASARRPSGARICISRLQLAFEEALAGRDARRDGQPPRDVPHLRGHGPHAHDHGHVPRVPGQRAPCGSVRGHMVFSRSCPACSGSGQQRPRPCEPCGGIGQETRSETVQVRIPAGVGDGDRVRVAGQGQRRHPRRAARRPVHHDAWSRRTRSSGARATTCTWCCRSRCTRRRSARGSTIAAPDGAARLRVPPGTQSGQRFRLRERGAPSTRDGRRGDLVVEVRLMLPRCSTSARRSCSGSSAGSTAKTSAEPQG